MPLNALTREYLIPDADLVAFTFGLISSMTRDNVEFTARGVLAADRNALQALAEAFESFPNDEYYRADVSLASQNKETTRADMQVKIRDIVQCAIIKWGEGSPQYKKFSAQKMTTESDKTFITTARQVVTLATSYLAVLTPVGLTQAMITALDTAADTFHNQLIAIKDAQEVRDGKTQERIAKGNEIYQLVVKYCTIGKIIWDDVDEAKYNDYIIYPATHPGLPKPQNVTAVYNPAVDEDIILSWDTVPGATFYEVFYSIVATGAPSGSYNLLNTFTTSPQQIPPVLNKRNYFKIKAKNDTQTSDYSDEAWVDVP